MSPFISRIFVYLALSSRLTQFLNGTLRVSYNHVVKILFSFSDVTLFPSNSFIGFISNTKYFVCSIWLTMSLQLLLSKPARLPPSAAAEPEVTAVKVLVVAVVILMVAVLVVIDG